MVTGTDTQALRVSLVALAVLTVPACTRFSGVIWEIDGDVITKCTGTAVEEALRRRGSIAPLPGLGRGWELQGGPYDGVTIEARRGKTFVSLTAPESRPRRTPSELAAWLMPARELAQALASLCDSKNSLVLKCIPISEHACSATAHE